MTVLIDTSILPVRDRLAAIHTAMIEAVAPCHVIHEDPEAAVHARMEHWTLGDARVLSTNSSGLRLLRTAKQARDAANPTLALSVQDGVVSRYVQFDALRVARPGELLIADLSSPYEFSWSGNGRAATVQVPYEALGLPFELVRRAVANTEPGPLYRVLADHVVRVTAEAETLEGDPASTELGSATVELVRALVVSAAHSVSHAGTVLAETLVTRVRAYVRQHLDDPTLTPTSVAAAHNVSVRMLYKVCAQAGFSLEQWIIGERLQAARDELARRDSRARTIAAIARRWGFADPTHFARRFRAEYGLTPREFRRAASDTATDVHP
jgi:AraC-like DNA-binding protein